MSDDHCWQSHDQCRIIELIKQLAPREGYTQTRLDDVTLMRWNRAIPRSPVLYEPSIVIVCQGHKIGYLGNQVYHYNARQFLVLSVPLPFESETMATAEEPLLAISIRINLPVLSELILQLDHGQPLRQKAAALGIVSTPLDIRLSNTVLRLLEALTSENDTAILGPAILREIHYRALTSAQGAAIRATLAFQSHVGKIGKALRRIHGEFGEDLNVNVLAAEAGMSVPAFHASFKAVTATSPMQYLKMTRLHKARLLMIQQGVTAAYASTQVGYESPSQFSREFKRLFGRTPSEEAAGMRQSLAVSQSAPASRYVTVQQ